jgi:hypothetical protein
MEFSSIMYVNYAQNILQVLVTMSIHICWQVHLYGLLVDDESSLIL